MAAKQLESTVIQVAIATSAILVGYALVRQFASSALRKVNPADSENVVNTSFDQAFKGGFWTPWGHTPAIVDADSSLGSTIYDWLHPFQPDIEAPVLRESADGENEVFR